MSYDCLVWFGEEKEIVIGKISYFIFGPAMQVMVSLSLNSLSWKWVEREEEIGQSVFVWSKLIASP